MNLNEAKEILQKSGYMLESFYSDIELKSLDIKDGDLYATIIIDTEQHNNDYNIYPGDEFTSKVRFNNRGEPYVTGLNGSDYRWYFGGTDYRNIINKARSLR